MGRTFKAQKKYGSKTENMFKKKSTYIYTKIKVNTVKYMDIICTHEIQINIATSIYKVSELCFAKKKKMIYKKKIVRTDVYWLSKL